MRKTKSKPKMMDADTFLRKLGRLKGNGWGIDEGEIRCRSGWCPILALYRDHVKRSVDEYAPNFPNSDYVEAGKALCIPEPLAHRIAAAADGDKRLATFRRRLLTTLGLV